MSRRRTDDENKDSVSHQHLATEQELKVAEKAREHQVEIEEEIEVEAQKAAELNKRFREEKQHKANEVQKGVTQKQREMQQATDRGSSQGDCSEGSRRTKT